MCLISSRADFTLKSQASCRELSLTKLTSSSVHVSRRSRPSFFSRYPSSASDCNWVLRQCRFLRDFSWNVLLDDVRLCTLTSRGSLFVAILLLLSDPYELGCSALLSSALSLLNTTSPPMSSLLLARVTFCVSLLLTSLVTRAGVLVSSCSAGLCA